MWRVFDQHTRRTWRIGCALVERKTSGQYQLSSHTTTIRTIHVTRCNRNTSNVTPPTNTSDSTSDGTNAIPTHSSAASSGVPSSDSSVSVSLTIPLLLRRLATGRWKPQQVRTIVHHILLAYHALPQEMCATFQPAATVEAPTTPLNSIAYETLLTSTQQVDDLETFDLVWNYMNQQLKIESTNRPFCPSPVMYICRMTLLISHKRYSDVEAVFREWSKRVSDASSSGEKPSRPTLLGYHVLIQSYIAGGERENSQKVIKLWHEIKREAQTERDVSPPATSTSSSISASFQPTHGTFHLILHSLLQHVTVSTLRPRIPISAGQFALHQLSPLLLDMEHQFHLQPDWTTFTLVIQTLKGILAATTNAPDKETMGATKQRELLKQQAIDKAVGIWNSAKARGEALSRQPQTSSATNQPNPLSFLPPPLWFAWLDLTIQIRRLDLVLSALDSMRSIGLLPQMSHCDYVLDLIGTLAQHRSLPPKLPKDADEEDIRIAQDKWRRDADALAVIQEQAADAAVHLIRCIRTHQIESSRRATITNLDSTTVTAPASVSSPTPSHSRGTTLSHYLSTFAILSAALRFHEFARLWKHFQVEYGSQSQSPISLRSIAEIVLDPLVKCALRIEVADAGGIVDELPPPHTTQTDTPPAETASGESNVEPAPATVLAYSILRFFQPPIPSPSHSINNTSESSPGTFSTSVSSVVSLLHPSTRVLLMRSLLSSGMIDEFASILDETKGIELREHRSINSPMVTPTHARSTRSTVTKSKPSPSGTSSPNKRSLHTYARQLFRDPLPAVPPDQSLYSLHSASSVDAVARCVSALLGLKNDAASVGVTDDSSVSGGGGYRMQSGPILLSGAVYELIFAKLTAYPNPHLADQVYHYMILMNMQPSRSINKQLLHLLAHAEPRAMWTEAIKRFRWIMTDLNEDTFINDEANEYAQLTIISCIRAGGQPEIVSEIYQLMASRPVQRATLELIIRALSIPVVLEPSHLSIVKSAFSSLLVDGTKSIGGDTWTAVIIAHANAGKIQQLLDFMKRQRGKSQRQRTVEDTLSPSTVPSVRSYLSSIIACVEKDQLDMAAKLFVELHGDHLPVHASANLESLVDTDKAHVEAPFAFQLHSTEKTEIRSILKFQFGPLALRQFRSAQQLFLRTLEKRNIPGGSLEEPVKIVLHVLDELATSGRVYLSLAFVHLIDSLGVCPMTPRISNLLLRSSMQCRPYSAYLQSEAVLLWMMARRIEIQDISWVWILRSYTESKPPQWTKAIELKSLMDDLGVAPSEKFICALIECCSCALDPDMTSELDLGIGMRRGADRVDDAISLTPIVRSRDVPDVDTAPLRAAQELMNQIHPSLLSPGMHVQAMVAAVTAEEYQLALQIFQTQYNGDVGRMNALQALQSEAFADPSRYDDSSSILANPPDTLYFRSCLDLSAWNGLMRSASKIIHPFLVYDLWMRLQSGEAFRVPWFKPPTPTTSNQMRNISSTNDGEEANTNHTPPTVWYDNPMQYNYSTLWHLVVWLDPLRRLKLEKRSQPPSRVTQLPDASNAPGETQQTNAPWQLPTFSFPRTLTQATTDDIETIIRQLRLVETIAYDSLSRPTGEHSQSVWQPFSQLSNYTEPTKPIISGSPSPFHINLHGTLPHSGGSIRSNIESILHLTLRHIRRDYVVSGKLESTGWTIVHGYGKLSNHEHEEMERHRQDRTRRHQPADEEKWRVFRYRRETSDIQIPTSPIAQIVHRFVKENLDVQPFLLMEEGNPGMTQVPRHLLEKGLNRT